MVLELSLSSDPFITILQVFPGKFSTPPESSSSSFATPKSSR